MGCSELQSYSKYKEVAKHENLRSEIEQTSQQKTISLYSLQNNFQKSQG